jgi:hypothetical protein
MAAMKRYLIHCALAASGVSHAGTTVPPSGIVEIKQPRAVATVAVKAPVAPRHLSEQERIELRKQLTLFDSQYRKRQ